MVTKVFNKDLFKDCIQTVREGFPEQAGNPEFIMQKAQILYNNLTMSREELRQMGLPKEDSITCMICFQSFRSLKRHLKEVHHEGLNNDNFKDYRNAYNIPADVPLAAKCLSKERSKNAYERQGARGFVSTKERNPQESVDSLTTSP